MDIAVLWAGSCALLVVVLLIAEHDRCDMVSALAVVLGHHVGVLLEGEGDRCVAEALRHNLGALSVRDVTNRTVGDDRGVVVSGHAGFVVEPDADSVLRCHRLPFGRRGGAAASRRPSAARALEGTPSDGKPQATPT